MHQTADDARKQNDFTSSDDTQVANVSKEEKGRFFACD
jgi:hypothetical protein